MISLTAAIWGLLIAFEFAWGAEALSGAQIVNSSRSAQGIFWQSICQYVTFDGDDGPPETRAPANERTNEEKRRWKSRMK